MKKIIALLIIFILIVFFTKFYDINNILEKLNISFNIWEKITDDNKNNTINSDYIIYNTWNITYIDANWKEYTWIWTITLKYNNQEITILDRNLWATTNDINSVNSYWLHFQWWNNYGFPTNTWEIKTQRKEVDVTWYWPSEYTSWTYAIWYYWQRMKDHYTNWKNLRWWWDDNKENNRWLNYQNYQERKWPCPNWYHVPSIWERNKLVETRLSLYTDNWWKIKCVHNKNRWLIRIVENDECNEEIAMNNFVNSFKIPLAWWFNCFNLYHRQGFDFWTSTFKHIVVGSNKSMIMTYESQYSDSLSIRCFSNNNKYN